MEHKVEISGTPKFELANSDIVFTVYEVIDDSSRKTKIGVLSISKGGIKWKSAGKHKGSAIPKKWSQFDALFTSSSVKPKKAVPARKKVSAPGVTVKKSATKKSVTKHAPKRVAS